MGFEELGEKYAAAEAERMRNVEAARADHKNKTEIFRQGVPRVVDTVIVPVLKKAQTMITGKWHRAAEVYGTQAIEKHGTQYHGPRHITQNQQSVQVVAAFKMGLSVPKDVRIMRMIGWIAFLPSFGTSSIDVFVTEPEAEDGAPLVRRHSLSLNDLVADDVESAQKVIEGAMIESIEYLRNYGRSSSSMSRP